MARSVYEIVTERILERLEHGEIPWHKPWGRIGPDGFEAPANLTTGRPYRGVNVFMLGCQGRGSRYWITYKQAGQLGGHVRKGERSSPLLFWKWLDKERRDETTGQPRAERVPMLRYYNVFSVEQCEGLTHPMLDAERRWGTVERAEPERIAAAEALVEGYKDGPGIQHGGMRACYAPLVDVVEMPPRSAFESMAAYYTVLFHELSHSTGHRSRLNRESLRDNRRFADHSYSREELVAEMGASFLRAFAAIDSEPLLENSAAYLQNWIQKLRGDSRLVVVAAAQAQKAADWIRGLRFGERASGY